MKKTSIILFTFLFSQLSFAQENKDKTLTPTQLSNSEAQRPLRKDGGGPGFGRGGPGSSDFRPRQAMQGSGPFNLMLLKTLNLTEEQKKKLKEMNESKRPVLREKTEALKQAHVVFTEALKGDPTDEQLRTLHEKITSLNKEIANQRFELIISVRSVLTPEQKKKFKELQINNQINRKRQHGRFGAGGVHRGSQIPGGPPGGEDCSSGNGGPCLNGLDSSTNLDFTE